MKKMLFVQNVRMTPQKPNKKSEKKRKKLRRKVFKFLFQGIEALWIYYLLYIIIVFKLIKRIVQKRL